MTLHTEPLHLHTSRVVATSAPRPLLQPLHTITHRYRTVTQRLLLLALTGVTAMSAILTYFMRERSLVTDPSWVAVCNRRQKAEPRSIPPQTRRPDIAPTHQSTCAPSRTMCASEVGWRALLRPPSSPPFPATALPPLLAHPAP